MDSQVPECPPSLPATLLPPVLPPPSFPPQCRPPHLVFIASLRLITITMPMYIVQPISTQSYTMPVELGVHIEYMGTK